MKRILRPKEAMAKLGIGHSKYYDDIKKGVLPPLVRLGPKSVGHVEDDLDAPRGTFIIPLIILSGMALSLLSS